LSISFELLAQKRRRIGEEKSREIISKEGRK
jgi:hypothetical protein